jgi:hypothetical protein
MKKQDRRTLIFGIEHGKQDFVRDILVSKPTIVTEVLFYHLLRFHFYLIFTFVYFNFLDV